MNLQNVRRTLAIGSVICCILGALFSVAAVKSLLDYRKFTDVPVVQAVIVKQNKATDGRVDSVVIRINGGRARTLENLQGVSSATLGEGQRIDVRLSGDDVVLADVGRIVRDCLILAAVAFVILAAAVASKLVSKRIES